MEYNALVTATRNAGVEDFVFIGAHEISEGQWQNTDNTGANTAFLTSKGWCAQTASTTSEWNQYAASTECVSFDNLGDPPEDTMAYCNEACIVTLAGVMKADYSGMRPGLHDCGNSRMTNTRKHPACKFPPNVNPPIVGGR
jgi:hypothetical protein